MSDGISITKIRPAASKNLHLVSTIKHEPSEDATMSDRPKDLTTPISTQQVPPASRPSSTRNSVTAPRVTTTTTTPSHPMMNGLNPSTRPATTNSTSPYSFLNIRPCETTAHRPPADSRLIRPRQGTSTASKNMTRLPLLNGNNTGVSSLPPYSNVPPVRSNAHSSPSWNNSPTLPTIPSILSHPVLENRCFQPHSSSLSQMMPNNGVPVNQTTLCGPLLFLNTPTLPFSSSNKSNSAPGERSNQTPPSVPAIPPKNKGANSRSFSSVPIAKSSPGPPDAPSNSANGATGDPSMIWGRVTHLSDGSIQFSGVSRHTVSGASTISKRIVMSTSALELEPSTFMESEVPDQTLSHRWLDQTPLVGSRRVGFHACLCCQRTFTNQSLFEIHMFRPIAHLLYRCQFCANSESTSEVQQPARSPFCTVRSDGIVQAPNRCALYSHFVWAHLESRSDWEVISTRLSISTLPPEVWNSYEPATDPASTSRPSSVNGDCTTTMPLSVYRTGMELVGVWRDFQSSFTESLPHLDPNLLNSLDNSIDFGLHQSCFGAPSLCPAHQSSSERFSSLTEGFPSQLPSMDSPLNRVIVRLAQADLRQMHVFLTDWCQESPPQPPVDDTSTTINSPPAQDVALANGDRKEPEAAECKQMQGLPPAPTTQALLDFLNASNRPSHSNTRVSSPCVTASTAVCSRGVLRCLLCTYRTDDPQKLREHLTGVGSSVTIRCALCSQPVPLQQPNLCAIKAHLFIHSGCCIMCPECGFTPPPYLAPDAYELCLRTHLRFFCFHYNFFQVFLCPYRDQLCGKVFSVLFKLAMHILDSHVQRIYACLWCARAAADKKAAASDNGAPSGTTSTAPREVAVSDAPITSRFPTTSELLTHMNSVHHAHLHSPSTTPVSTSDGSMVDLDKSSTQRLVPGVDFIGGYPCTECAEVFDVKDCFVQHILTTHAAGLSRIGCYRCFGSCKQLSSSLEEFKTHLKSCRIATDLYVATFSRLGDSSVARSALCSCPYCVIAERPSNSAVLCRDSKQTDAAQQADDSITAVQTDESTGSACPPGTQDPVQKPTSTIHYFRDLRALHAHEDQYHLIPNSNQVACPWCGHRLSCVSKEDIHQTIDHLRSHIRDYNYATWQRKRSLQWERDTLGLPHCHCGSAVLDAPLSIMSHGSSHLLPLLSRPPDPVPIRSTIGDGCNSISTLPKPAPSPHLPCTPDVYRHLRLASHPELDHYLDQALLLRRPFVCPVCSTPSLTRWALCEHAFVEHWGSLCYICCEFVVPTTLSSGNSSDVCDPPPNRSPVHTSERQPASSPDFWQHVYQCLCERRRSLRTAARTSSPRKKCDPQAEDTLPANDTYQAILNWRLRKSSVEPNDQSAGDAASAEATTMSPIVIPSSPDDSIGPVPSPDVCSRSSSSTIPKRRKGESHTSNSDVKHRRHASTVDVEYPEGRSEPAAPDVESIGTPSSNATVQAMDIDFPTVLEESGSFTVCESSTQIAVPKRLFTCVICGEQVTTDLWEEHTLRHRNPQMAWSGLSLSEPHRIVLGKSRGKIYKCYLCQRLFITRRGCQKHMINIHKLSRGQIDWSRLVENAASTMPNVPEPRIAPQPPPNRSEPPAFTHPPFPLTTDSQPPFYCTLCRISFLSERAMSIHRAAAHSHG